VVSEARLRELYKFFETTAALYVQVRRWPTAAMFKFMKTGDKVLKVLGFVAWSWDFVGDRVP
jgi:hypothetical protein